MSKVVRSVKNVTKGYTSAQVKVRNATSNDAWGPVGSDMAEIAQMTFDTATFYEIMDILDKRLNDKGKNWRHVLKSLKVLDYCLHEGSEHVVTWSRKNIYIIKTLREFQHIDEDGKDVGQNIRVSAKELTSLILNEERLRAERQDRRNWKSRVTGLDDFATHAPPPPPDQGRSRHRDRGNRPNEDDDLEYRLALEASKNEAEEDARRRQNKGPADGDDSDLAKAIKLSKEEEELRRRELEDANANSLFDDTPTPQPAASQPTGWNQGYQQQPAVDWFGNAIDPQQQQQPTGYGMPQQTGFQNGFGYPGMQQQQTGYQNPAMTGFMQPQQTAFHSNNPYSHPGQPTGLDAFGQQQQSQDLLNPGSNNPWASNNAAQELKPAPTGSNNPFANGFGKPVQQQQTFKAPSLNTLAEQQATTSFNPIMNYQAPQQPLQQQQPSSSFPVQPSSPQPTAQPQNPHHARLNQLLASGEGQDTFGNVGEMRIPAQHTAPGVFVNSAGAGAQRLTSTATGNPFMQSQFTGMPNTTAGLGAGRQFPAQTGPAGSANPFGTQQTQQQQQGGYGGYGQQQQQQHGPGVAGGSLIDL